MPSTNPIWRRHDWQRFVRHDAYRFMAPDPNAYTSYATRLLAQRREEEKQAEHDAALQALGAQHLELRRELAELKFELFWRRLCRKYGYNPNQPRVPAGNREGGQWTDDEQGTSASEQCIRLAASDKVITDAFGQPYYQLGGHHEVTRDVFGKWPLRPETRKVFEQATTGTLPKDTIRTAPDGKPIGHFWNGKNGPHGIYNQAVRELSERFLERNNIKPENMTPDQARGLLKEVRESNDPRIRDYNNALRILRRLKWLRPGRGPE